MPLPSVEFRKSLESMASNYQLAMSEAALSYLSGRGIGPEAVEHYRLGQVDASHAEHESYAGMLCIPYLTRAGVVSLKFRSLAGKSFVNPSGKTHLFNTLAMDRADREGVLAICEGEIDTITLDYYCGIPAVGIPGVDAHKAHPEWRELFRGYREVLIFQDNDPEQERKRPDGTVEKFRPGAELSKRLMADIDTARIVRLPGHDVNESFVAFGAEGIRKAAGL